ncbi:MAG TPA: allantoate amidohydrolase [Beijerinckiaceae bacterium]|nr:allantoate amidohydrolase [Beijerinckiaceae bacterium]
MTSLGARVMALVDALARHTDEPGRLTRLYLSQAHRATAEATLGIMREAGLDARIDAVGNVIGRYEGERAGAPALIVGSHLDSVVDAGRFDGPLGVVCGIVAVEALAREGLRLPFAIEAAAFGDEENVRFPTNLSTSYALAGRYDPKWLDAPDADGIVLRDALVGFGGDPDGVPAVARRPKEVVGYLEVHIEQGPLLEAKNLPVGIVSAINGITRARARVVGEAGHAGTVPMKMRRDALAAVAEMIALVERIGARREDTVATVGVAQVRPGAVNVIPGEVDFTIDARAPHDPLRNAMVEDIERELRAIAERRGVSFAVDPFMDSPATAMEPQLIAALEEGARALGVPPFRLPSGAGHDAVAMATLCPAAMLFVRCKGGISHNPAESITEADADVAVRVLLEAVKRLGSGRLSAVG